MIWNLYGQRGCEPAPGFAWRHVVHRVDPLDADVVGAGVELRAHALGDRLLAADYDAAVGELAILEAVLAALPAIAERRRLLDGPLRTLTGAARAIETAAGARSTL